MEKTPLPTHYASADEPTLQGAHAPLTLEQLLVDRNGWGRLVESAVGTHILNSSDGDGIETLYWREGNHEVDFVLKRGDAVVGIEVKSGRSRQNLASMAAFIREFKPQRSLLVGGQGIPLQEFFCIPVRDYL